MKVVGYRKSDFRTKDGTEIKGYNLYLTEPIVAEDGKGTSTEHLYLSEKKIADNNLDLSTLVGKEIVVTYNKWAKPERIFLSK
jgi:hypothetical protein